MLSIKPCPGRVSYITDQLKCPLKVVFEYFIHILFAFLYTKWNNFKQASLAASGGYSTSELQEQEQVIAAHAVSH